jgi:4-amino-4-deoxy-L-arabinose transferase-like glycosyltransferase
MPKKINISLISVLVIFFVAAFLRFYQLGSLPPSLTWDEVALGYNAYSLGMDGRDEFGKLLPYDYLLSFGDYKPPLYAYLTTLPIIMFGLTEFSVRFASAFFGTLTVLVTYFLVKELFSDRKNIKKSSYINTEFIAILSMLFMAISPWHIMLSRAAFEANVATFFIVSGVWLFLRGVHKHPVFLIVSALCFTASLYTFNTARVVSPLLVLILAIGYRQQLWQFKGYSAAAIVTGVLLIAPILSYMTSAEARLRYAEVNIFSDTSIVETANQEITNDNNALWSKLLHNRRVAYAREYTTHYFDHFNPRFLFITGDENIKFSTRDVGQMYLWDLPFLLIGILFIIKNREKRLWFIPLWLLIGIIPSAVARETPHALRIESTLPTWQILTAYGFVVFSQSLIRYKKTILTVVSAVLFLFVTYFLHGYYSHYAKESSRAWQYSYKEAVTYVGDNQNKYDRVYISNALERSYIYTLFYLQYDPEKFRKEVKKEIDQFGFVQVNGFNKYKFANNIETLPKDGKKILYIDSPDNVPERIKILKEFKTLKGEVLLIAYSQ